MGFYDEDDGFNERFEELVGDPKALEARVYADDCLQDVLLGARPELNLVQAALDQGASPNRPIINGYPPLHLAVHRGKMDLLKAFYDSGARVNDVDDGGRTALDEALRLGFKEAAVYLEERDGKTRAELDEKKIHVSSYQRRINDFMLMQAGGNTGSQYTGLQAALLLGGDPNSVEEERAAASYPALHCAVASCHVKKVRLLIKAGSDIHATSALGESAMDALWYPQDGRFLSPEWHEIFDLLKAAGCGGFFTKKPAEMTLADMRQTVPVKTKEKMTVLEFLAETGHFDIVFERLKNNPQEMLGYADFVRDEKMPFNNLIGRLSRKNLLKRVFTPEVFQGRHEEMYRVWQAVGPYYRKQVDIEHACRDAVNYKMESLKKQDRKHSYNLNRKM